MSYHLDTEYRCPHLDETWVSIFGGHLFSKSQYCLCLCVYTVCNEALKYKLLAVVLEWWYASGEWVHYDLVVPVLFLPFIHRIEYHCTTKMIDSLSFLCRALTWSAHSWPLVVPKHQSPMPPLIMQESARGIAKCKEKAEKLSSYLQLTIMSQSIYRSYRLMYEVS